MQYKTHISNFSHFEKLLELCRFVAYLKDDIGNNTAAIA